MDVLPVTWTSIGNYEILIVAVIINYAFKGSPGVLNIVEITPKITVLDYRRKIGLKVYLKKTSDKPKEIFSIETYANS